MYAYIGLPDLISVVPRLYYEVFVFSTEIVIRIRFNLFKFLSDTHIYTYTHINPLHNTSTPSDNQPANVKGNSCLIRLL